MSQAARRAILSEVAEVLRVTDDPEFASLRVAIYLEDALDTALPPDVLDRWQLGSPAAIEQLLDGFEQR